MTKNPFAFILSVALLVSCATTQDGEKSKQIVTGDGYEIRISDNLEGRKFEIEFVSKAAKDLCIEFGEWPYVPEENGWPRSLGSLHFMSDQVYVLAGGERYPIKKTNFGLCETADASIDPRACSTVVAPGISIKSVIPYEEFEGKIPTGRSVKRELFYDPHVDFCDGLGKAR